MIEVGDCLPVVRFRKGDGSAIVLSDQRIAGAPLVISIVGAGGADAAAAFAQADLTYFAVQTDQEDGSPSEHVLIDADGAFAKTVGLADPCFLVVGADQRVLAKLENIANLSDVVQQARQVIDAVSVTVRRVTDVQAPVLIVRGLFESALCTRLIDHWAGQDKRQGGVASTQANDNDLVRADFKRRADVIVEDRALFETVKTRIAKRAAPLMFRAFQFQLASMEALRVGCYDAADQGFFGRHRDNGTPYTAWRKFAMSVNLNGDDAGTQYEGGGIVFPEFGPHSYAPGTGDAVIFSCSLLHEVAPVTQGQRYGLFTFFTDAAGLAAQKAAQEKSRAAGGSGAKIS